MTVDPTICGGRPVVTGTRVRVSDVLVLLAASVSKIEILDDYPYLIVEDIRACMAFAARSLSHPVVFAPE